VPFSFSDTVTFTADFALNSHLSGVNWLVDVVIVGIPLLQFGAVTAGILAALALVLGAALASIPFIGPFLAGAVVVIIAAIGIAGVTGLLGVIVTPFVAGLRFNMYKQPQRFPLLPGTGPIDPEVDVKITALDARVQLSDKNELLIEANLAA